MQFVRPASPGRVAAILVVIAAAALGALASFSAPAVADAAVYLISKRPSRSAPSPDFRTGDTLTLVVEGPAGWRATAWLLDSQETLSLPFESLDGAQLVDGRAAVDFELVGEPGVERLFVAVHRAPIDGAKALTASVGRDARPQSEALRAAVIASAGDAADVRWIPLRPIVHRP